MSDSAVRIAAAEAARPNRPTHREEYFFTTDPGLSPAAVIGYYRGRWNVETTFQECRSALGRETTRGW